MSDHGVDGAVPPFEGPEKLLEIWFAQSPDHVPDASAAADGKFGLRKVPREVWEDMLAIVKCQVLSVVEGDEIDAYLLSESSLFVSPHRLILKTCGTTLNLLGVPRILEIASTHASLHSVYRCFYSRKSFMFPERQLGPHREWKDEVKFLDDIFHNGSAYTVGKMNGDHWLLYMTGPEDGLCPSSPVLVDHDEVNGDGVDGSPPVIQTPDYTIEILMTHLSPEARAPFFTPDLSDDENDETPSAHALALSSKIGITELFPPQLTTLDAYSFTPCGYSSNALLKWGQDESADPGNENGAASPPVGGEGYYTIHVTPEEGWSYASFECNVPLPTQPTPERSSIPDLKTLIRRIVRIFQPGKITLTLFISSVNNSNVEEEDGVSAVEAAQKAFKAALTRDGEGEIGAQRVYRRTDKINYEFGGYDLAFATFEMRS